MSGRRIVTLSLIVYGLLAALGLAWAAWRGRPFVFVHPDPWLELSPAWSHGASLIGGAGLALSTLGLTRLWVRRFRWARDLHLAFRDTLGRTLDGGVIVTLALASAIGEEIFFRGALQPSLGWVLTSLGFGLVHVGPDRRFLPWTVWAVVMGFALGAIYEATGSLWGPILAHAWINHENLHFIAWFDPREPPEEDRSSPRLVHRSERR